MAEPQHGTDIHCVDDIDSTLSLVSGRTCLAEACARRIITPRLGLFYDRDYGYDTRQFLGAAVRPAAIQQKIDAEIAKDERVFTSGVGVTFIDAAEADVDETPDSLEIEIRVTDYEGPFDFTVAIDDLTVELLGEID
jgi:hypothetical protein